MNDLVGIIRTRGELEQSLQEIEKLKERAEADDGGGHRQYNPGWHLAIDLRNMLLVSECIAKTALAREESRGGSTRDDFPRPTTRCGAPRTWSATSTRPAPGSTCPRSRCR